MDTDGRCLQAAHEAPRTPQVLYPGQYDPTPSIHVQAAVGWFKSADLLFPKAQVFLLLCYDVLCYSPPIPNLRVLQGGDWGSMIAQGLHIEPETIRNPAPCPKP